VSAKSRTPNPAPVTIDDYIARSSRPIQPILRRIRNTVRRAVPAAQETISYRMPAFRLHGVVLYFAAFKHHIGVFPPVRGDATLTKDLLPYAGAKGNLRFPLDRPIPYGLIFRIARLRARQNREKTANRHPVSR
jgi:uncharacterized protein YdhG (YjbR/CyaY superfamily)